jgi:CRP/FNR family transcriptional regulator
MGQQMHQAFAEAVEESLICILSRDDVETLIVKKPQVAIRMLEVLSTRLAKSESQLEALAYHGVPARLASALLHLVDAGEVRVTHRELAEMIGAYRETVTKTLDEFQRDGLVELGRMHIVIADRSRLAEIAGIEAPGG